MAPVKTPKATRAAIKPAAPRIAPLPYKAPSGAAAATRGPTPSSPELPLSLRGSAPPRIDPSSSAYKAASRKYIGFMVAMPILLVTSYVLFDRLALGHEAKSFEKKSTPDVL